MLTSMDQLLCQLYFRAAEPKVDRARSQRCAQRSSGMTSEWWLFHEVDADVSKCFASVYAL